MGLFSSKQQNIISKSILPENVKNEILSNRLPQIINNKIFLKDGEICSYIDKAILNIYKTKKISQHIGFSSKGLFKGSRMGIGIAKPIEYEDLIQQKGILYITNKRVVFQAKQNAFDKKHNYLSSIEAYTNAVILQYGNKTYEIIVADGNIVKHVLQLINS